MTAASKTDIREKDEKGAHTAGAPGTIKGDKQRRKSEFSKLKVSLYRKACEKVGKGMKSVWALVVQVTVQTLNWLLDIPVA